MSRFQAATENLRCCWTTLTKTSQQDSVEMGRFWNLQRVKFEIRKSIMTKKIGMWNVNKVTAARTKTEVDKLWTRFSQ